MDLISQVQEKVNQQMAAEQEKERLGKLFTAAAGMLATQGVSPTALLKKTASQRKKAAKGSTKGKPKPKKIVKSKDGTAFLVEEEEQDDNEGELMSDSEVDEALAQTRDEQLAQTR
jgi:regulator of protease activity HflC (stomatin/prohibitin superfamily)